MNEVEMMYRNAHVYPKVYRDITKENFENKAFNMVDMCNQAFTAEKQIELIKWLMNYPMLDEISLFFNEPSKTFNLRVYSLPEIGDFRSTYTETQNNFEDMLCGLINNLWQDLTEEEKQQIKEILNE